MKLHSFFEPGLRASDTHYTLTAKQTLSSANEAPLITKSSLSFAIDAPRFSIPVSDIHSVYPTAGSLEHARVLPHVVLNDPQLPWERLGPEDYDGKFNRQPWMALMVFTADELQTTPPLLDSATVKNTPSATRSLSASVSQLSKADQAQASFRCPNVNALDVGDETPTTYIVLRKQLFETLIIKNEPIFSYLSHVRRVSVTGSAHVSDTPEEHPFSVVISPRTGPLDGKEQVVYVHLVSLDGIVENLKEKALSADVQTVGVISLYAWTYRIAPGDEISYRDILSDLNHKKQPLCRPKDLVDSLRKDEANAWLVERLQNGYSLTRHRMLSGETSLAFYRGPLTPVSIPPGQCAPSTAGRELQILDPRTAIMDVSYSVAWELGRNLAVADKTFTAAMLRLRSDIMAYAVTDPTRSKSKSTFAALGRKHERTDLYSGVYRWANTKSSTVKTPPSSTSVDSSLQTQVRTWLETTAKNQAEAEITKTPSAASSTDWLFVLEWVKGKLALQGVPALYLFPDPAVVPLEALRTFYVDENWTDALVDGALSIANHSLGDDLVKREIRKSFNTYFTAIQNTALPTPWRPRWGLVLRSQLVRAYPNLRIARENNDIDVPASFTTLTDDTLIYFQTETPETTKDTALVITQPFHHQRFSLGDDLTANKLEMSFKLFGTNGSEDKAKQQLESAINQAVWHSNGSSAVFKSKTDTFKEVSLPPIYDWTTRCIDIKQLIRSSQELNKNVLPGLCDVQEDSSAYVGIQLNDEILMLQMNYKRPHTEDPKPRLLNDPPSSQTSSPPVTTPTPAAPKHGKSMFTPEPPLINTTLLPPVHGFDMDSLQAAVPFLPSNTTSYNNLLPITTSQLCKICSPLLEQPRRNFPAGTDITLDIVFSMTAISDVRQDLYLHEVTVYIPTGQINTNLLRPITARPKTRMIGPGRLWNITSRLVKGKRHRINLEGEWDIQDAVDGHEQVYLSITISPLQGNPLHLLRHGQVSFILHEMQINPLPCERIPLLVEEAYCRLTEEGNYEEIGRVRAVVGVTKQDCKWV